MSDQGFTVQRQIVDQKTRVTSRDVPFTALALSGTPATFATAPAQQMMKVRKLAACNPTGSAGTITLTVGGLSELSQFPIASHASVDLTEVIGGLYQAGAVLMVSGTSGVVLSGWFEAVQ